MKNTFLLHWFIFFILIVSCKILIHFIVSDFKRIISDNRKTFSIKCTISCSLFVRNFQSAQNVSCLINLSLSTTPRSSNRNIFTEFIVGETKFIPKTVINNSLSETLRKESTTKSAWYARHTNSKLCASQCHSKRIFMSLSFC